MASLLTVADLKEKLKTAGLPQHGLKSELVARLLNAGVSPDELRIVSAQEVTLEHQPGEVLQEATSIIETTIDPPTFRQGQDPFRMMSVPTTTHAEQEVDLLRRERDIAQREAELLRRELELLRVTPRPEASTPLRTTIRKWQELKDLIGEFNGTNWDFDRWEKQIRTLLSTYNLSNHEAKALMCSKLTGKAQKWYHSRVDCVELNCNDLLSELKRMYGQRPDQLVLRRKLEARTWKTGETFADYLHDKVTLANRVPVADTEIIAYVIEGIPSQELRTQAKVQCYQTVDAMLTAFANVPTPKEAQQKPFQQRRTDSAVDNSKTQDKERRKTKDTETRKCFNCNEMGHIAADCKKTKRERGSCFKCGKFGHRANQCNPPAEDVNCVTQCQQEGDEFRRKVELSVNREGNSFNVSLNALIDTGSPISFVKEDYIPREFMVKDSSHDKFYGVNGSGLKVTGRIKAILAIDKENYEMDLRVVPGITMKASVVLGRDFIKQANLTLSNEKAIDTTIDDIMNIDLDDKDATPQRMQINEDLPNEVKMRAHDLFRKHYVNAHRPSSPAVENVMQLTLLEKKPFSCTPRRLSYNEKAKLSDILDELSTKGIIRESTSEYASPIVLTKKKTGEIRMCVDFRMLNKITARDNFPIPLIEDQLNLLAGKKYFTTLDLKDGFFHIKMHEESIKYTSFVTPLGQYEYVKMPFGLKGAPLKFQRYVTQIFKEQIKTGEISVYLDDFLIATVTLEHHLRVLEKVFKLLVANCLELRLDKCQFLQTKLDYLGYTVTSEGICPTRQGLEAVLKFPVPRNVHDVQSFLGLCSYFRKFIEGFSLIAKPLYDLLRKDMKFRFDELERQTFET